MRARLLIVMGLAVAAALVAAWVLVHVAAQQVAP